MGFYRRSRIDEVSLRRTRAEYWFGFSFTYEYLRIYQGTMHFISRAGSKKALRIIQMEYKTAVQQNLGDPGPLLTNLPKRRQTQLSRYDNQPRFVLAIP
jgi:hypothetical protein